MKTIVMKSSWGRVLPRGLTRTAALVVLVGTPVSGRAQQATPITLDQLVGTWVGGLTDSAWVPQSGLEDSDTLMLKPDSTFLWTRNGQQRVMVNPQAPTDMRWKRLSNNNIGWFGGPGYNLTLAQKQLTMASVQVNQQTGQHVYLAFTRIGPPPAGSLASLASAVSAPGGAGSDGGTPVAPTPGHPVCQIQIAPIGSVLPAAMRAMSPLDSVSFDVANKSVKVCYGRPSARGRTMLGDQVPYGQLWRTGANEPTTLNTPIPLVVAGIKIPAGVYSLYTIPGETEWEIILNRSISQWGIESMYTSDVEAQEVGRGKVKPESIASPIETFTIRAEPVSGNPKGATLVLEWETTRVNLPIAAQ